MASPLPPTERDDQAAGSGSPSPGGSLSHRALLLFGAPGVGKGTQGRILGAIPGLSHLAMGDVFRGLDPDSELGRQTRSYFERGELVPDDLTARVWSEALSRHSQTGYRPGRDLLVLDGIPRNPTQAEALSERVEVAHVLHLAASDEEAMVHRIHQRALEEGRVDDADEAIIRRRFEIYHAESKAVLDWYPRELVTRVDALGSPAGVLRRILEIVVPLLGNRD
ncbi:MAG: nucleoside monophosphate kinase [Planctomycetes bacterium]|nr:nucleoside monophosphate kinase [Planctomycetota bacterium]